MLFLLAKYLTKCTSYISLNTNIRGPSSSMADSDLIGEYLNWKIILREYVYFLTLAQRVWHPVAGGQSLMLWRNMGTLVWTWQVSWSIGTCLPNYMVSHSRVLNIHCNKNLKTLYLCANYQRKRKWNL